MEEDDDYTPPPPPSRWRRAVWALNAWKERLGLALTVLRGGSVLQNCIVHGGQFLTRGELRFGGDVTSVGCMIQVEK